MAIYKGFSTANWLENKSLIISDIEAINFQTNKIVE